MAITTKQAATIREFCGPILANCRGIRYSIQAENQYQYRPMMRLGDGTPESALMGVHTSAEKALETIVKRLGWDGNEATFHGPAIPVYERLQASQAEAKAVEVERHAERQAAEAGKIAFREALKLRLKNTKFIKADVTMRFSGGREPEVYPALTLGGLAVLRAYPDRPVSPKSAWQVLHVASGAAIYAMFDNQTDAKVAAMRLLPVFDWAQPMEVIRESGSRLGPMVAALARDPWAACEAVDNART